MSSIKIYGLRGSLRTRSVLATLEELALPYDFVSTDFEKMKTQEFLVKQPWGKVPVLEDGSNFQLYESRAIIRYLVNSYDRAGALYPAESKARAVVDQWISIEQSYYVAAEDLISELIFGPLFGKTANEAKVKDAEVRLAKVLDVMDKHLAQSKFMGGDHFTIADIVYMPDTQLILARLPQYAALYNKHTHVTRWWQEISARASWQKVNSQSEF